MLSNLNKLDREAPLIFVGVCVVVAAFTVGLAAISYQPPVGCPNTAEVIRYFPAEKAVTALPQPVLWPAVDDRFWRFSDEEAEATLSPIVVDPDDPPPRRHRRRWWRRG